MKYQKGDLLYNTALSEVVIIDDICFGWYVINPCTTFNKYTKRINWFDVEIGWKKIVNINVLTNKKKTKESMQMKYKKGDVLYHSEKKEVYTITDIGEYFEGTYNGMYRISNNINTEHRWIVASIIDKGGPWHYINDLNDIDKIESSENKRYEELRLAWAQEYKELDKKYLLLEEKYERLIKEMEELLKCAKQ